MKKKKKKKSVALKNDREAAIQAGICTAPT